MQVETGFGQINFGQSNKTYETFYGESIEVSESHGDLGYSVGMSQIFFVGYHYSVSVSFSGVLIDLYDYFEERL